jgi:hypothetical protein
VAVLDGEEWCPKCQQYRRYRSHGWIGAGIDRTPCPEPSDARMAYRDLFIASVQRFDALYFAAVNVCIEHKRGTYADDADLDALCKALNDWEAADEDEEIERVRAERKAHEEAEAALRKILNADALDVHSIARAWLEAHP